MHAIDAKLHDRAAVEDDETAVTDALEGVMVATDALEDVTVVAGALVDVTVVTGALEDVMAATGALEGVMVVTDALEGVMAATDALEDATTVKTIATMMEAIERHEGSAKDTRTTNHHGTSVHLEDSIGKTKIEVVK